MSGRLTETAAWNRARAFKLHEHFQTVWLAKACGAKVTKELARVSRLLDGKMLTVPGGEVILEASYKTLLREWYYWLAGGRKGREQTGHVRKPEALLCDYRGGAGGHTKMPRLLIKELQRRCTLTTGGRDKNKKSPISVAYQSLVDDFAARKALPGVDYDQYPVGAEFPWCYRTATRHKPAKTLRLLGNVGGAAHKHAAAYVSLRYDSLRKGELYTLDDVRLDITCIDEATGQAIEVVCYVFMEVGSRLIVGYVMKPAAAIKGEDVDELLAHMLQMPGFGIGVGYTTHILFERGATACSEGGKIVLEGATENRIKVHKTGMLGGVRWKGSAADKKRGNAAGKAIIESFNRWLHYALLNLPGQRGNLYANQPENLGGLGGADFTDRQSRRKNTGTLVDQCEQLAQWNIATGRRLKLKLGMLYLMQLHEAVGAAIKRHNTEAGHDYKDHGQHYEAEVQPGVWQETATPVRKVRHYALHPTGEPASTGHLITAQDRAKYWAVWNRVQKALPGADRHAITREALGYAKSHKQFTRVEWGRVIAAFTKLLQTAAAA